MNFLEAIGQKLYFYRRYATAIYKHSDRVMTVCIFILLVMVINKSEIRHLPTSMAIF
jgi:hypothetical protein